METVICVTEKEYYKAEEVFKVETDITFIPASIEEDKLSDMISNNRAFGCILGVEDYSNRLYESLPQGGIIARFGVGHDGVDKQKATEKGLIVTNTLGVLDDSVAEHTIFLMGAISRNISRHNLQMKNNNWSPAIGSELKGKTLLVIGMGPIGKKTSKIASFGFGMDVIGCDITDLDQQQLIKDAGINKLVKSYENEIDKADYVSIHLPSIPATRHFVDHNFLSKMKTNAYLINTSRGPIVDETFLFDALKSGQIAGAALDVFEKEPYEPGSNDKDLRALDNVLLTPHIGSSTVEACERMAKSCIKNINAALHKEYDNLDILNPQVLNQL